MNCFNRLAGKTILIPVLFCLAATGCGYKFSGEGQGPRPGLHRIAIPVFENNTSEPNLGAIFASALRKEFIRKGHMQVVPVDQSEAVFYARIININTTAVAHHDVAALLKNRLTIESRLFVNLDIRCEDAKGKLIWRDPKFTYYKVFRQVPVLTNPDPMYSFDNRQMALQDLADDMAIRIHDRFLADF